MTVRSSNGHIDKDGLPIPQCMAEILFEMRDVLLLLTADRQIRYANRAADRILARKHPFKIRRGRLEADAPAGTLELGRAIDRACAKSVAGPEMLALRRNGCEPLIVAIRCIDPKREIISLLASDPKIEPQDVFQSLRTCFGLTRSEAEVAAAVANGASSTQLAAARNVSVNTIRTQIKTVAAKLGCTRHSQIGAIVRTVPLQRG